MPTATRRLATLTATLLLAACGGSDDDDDAAPSTTTTAAPAPAQESSFGDCILQVQPWALQAIGIGPAPANGITVEKALPAGTVERRIYQGVSERFGERARTEGAEAVAGDVLRQVQASCAEEYGGGEG
jgi:hypothetical protein